MNKYENTIFIGDTPQKHVEKAVRGETVDQLGEPFYKIHNFDAIEPFFMSIVSSSDHWLFISSTGGLTAGRSHAEQALFPYYTVDKIIENSENTGSKAIFLVRRTQRTSIWEPLTERYRGNYHIERNIYKNITNTAVMFEENNLDLGLTYRYAWRTSEKYGFIKTTWLTNWEDSACQVEFVDGIQNILPANVTTAAQLTLSSLLDAYKRSELDSETGLAIFALNATMTDLAEPSESLLATTAAQLGLEQADYLLSTTQLDNFRWGKGMTTETDVRGQRGAYLLHTTITLAAREECSWHILADVYRDHAAIVQRIRDLKGDRAELCQDLEIDINTNQQSLWRLVASADGLQLSRDQLCTVHHFANVMFNMMRGGIFADQYHIRRDDLREFIAVHSRHLLKEQADFFAHLPAHIQVNDLQIQAEATGSLDLSRMCASYLPLTFSRRHGDPSRPWNRFSINVKKPDGSQRLDYEGNWRDIFQNWEALAWSYPEYIENMLSTFLNATTFDGYNPYRITRSGVDWELPDPHNPWANIGYWGDHQIVYLQKLMEISGCIHPGKLQQNMARPIFSYANVPYRINPYEALLQNPYNTIEFDWELQREITVRVREYGTDAMLVRSPDGKVFHGTLAEKLLTLLLAKLVNFVPEGGIWMNTQRPEWNDANNALVGKGVSVVTLCYLRRYLVFCQELFSPVGAQEIPVLQEVVALFGQIADILAYFRPVLDGRFNDEQRRAMLDSLGLAGSKYRWDFYRNGISGAMGTIPAFQINQFIELALAYVDHSLRANRRTDNLYHTYNILHLSDKRAIIDHLYEMLEGQVAILSSRLLSGEEALALLNSLRSGPLYRVDQHSYILYPDRQLPGFLEKNRIPPERVQDLSLVQALVAAQDNTLITRDIEGAYHFSGNIRNIKDVNHVLASLQEQPQYASFVIAETEEIRSLFEEIFHHNEFTGRSSTFFAYEGLGSIYWHMVSKLLLAVQEVTLQARREPASEALIQALVDKYKDIRQGLGFRKSPEVFGAFPTDPYSHTPKGKGAKQPGMTGQVKEEILTRMGEVGLTVQNGKLAFDPFLLEHEELLKAPEMFTWLDVAGQPQSLEIPTGSLAYTFCQVPIILWVSHKTEIEVHCRGGAIQIFPGKVLDATTSKHIIQRDGQVHHLVVRIIQDDTHQ